MASYLNNEFGVARPDWAALHPRAVPYWGDAFDLTPGDWSPDSPEMRRNLRAAIEWRRNNPP